jgi:hypothetical protein
LSHERLYVAGAESFHSLEGAVRIGVLRGAFDGNNAVAKTLLPPLIHSYRG